MCEADFCDCGKCRHDLEAEHGPDTSGCETAEHIRSCGFCRAVIQIVLKEKV